MTAGDTGGQAFALGLIDHVVSVVFGSGKRYFGSFEGAERLLEHPDVVIAGERVLHVRYPVCGG